MVESDRRVTLREFVLLTLLRQRLREGAGQPIRTQFRRIEELAPDAHLVLSLVSLDPAAFEKGAARAQARLEGAGRARRTERAEGRASRSSACAICRRFAKPGILKACFEAAAADGVFRLAEAELVRMVAATLDCPLPPVLAAQDPQALPA